MNAHLWIALGTAGGLVALSNLIVALLGPVLNREGSRLAADKFAMEREHELREAGEKMRADLSAQVNTWRARAEAAEAIVQRTRTRCRRSCESEDEYTG